MLKAPKVLSDVKFIPNAISFWQKNGSKVGAREKVKFFVVFGNFSAILSLFPILCYLVINNSE